MDKFFLILLLTTSSYKNDEVKYYNHDKWKWTTAVMGWWFYEHVNNKPSEVKEYFYDSIHQDDKSHSYEFPAYIIRRFGKDGDMIYKEEVYTDSTHFISEYSYNGIGVLMKEYAVHKASKWGFDENDTGRISTEFSKDGKFKIKTYNASGVQPNPSYSLVTFLNNGKKVVIEEMSPILIQDTTNNLFTFIGFSDSLEVMETTTKEYDVNENILTDYHYYTHRDDW